MAATIQQKVVSFLKTLGRDKIVTTFQVSRQVANVWLNQGNVPLNKLDRVLEEMAKHAEQVEANLKREEEAKARDAAAVQNGPAPVPVTTSAPTPHEAFPLIPVVKAPPKEGDYEERFGVIDGRLDKIEDFIRRMTDPDLVRTSAFTRPQDDANKPNAVMQPLPVVQEPKVMTEAEHEREMQEVGNKIPGANDWLKPYETPPHKK